MSDGYSRKRANYGDQSGSLIVTPFVGQTTLVAAKGSYSVFVQRVHVHVTGAAAATWDIQDSAGKSLLGPVDVSSHITTVGSAVSVPTQDPIQAEYDFGAVGVQMTAGASLVFVPSATGATGVIYWDAYRRPPASMSLADSVL